MTHILLLDPQALQDLFVWSGPVWFSSLLPLSSIKYMRPLLRAITLHVSLQSFSVCMYVVVIVHTRD